MRHSNTLLLMQLFWRLDRRAGGGVGFLGWFRRITLGLIVVGASTLAGFTMGIFIKEGLLGNARIDVVPGLLLALVLFGTALSGFNQALQALYLSDDLEKLLVAPVPTRSVVAAKLLGRLPTLMFFLLGITTPALITFGYVLDLGPLYHIVGIVLLLVSPLFGISVGTIVAFLLVQLLPARRLSEWIGAASIVIGTLLTVLVYLPRLIRGDRGEFSPETEAAIGNALNAFADLPLPSNWAGSALVDLGQGLTTTYDFMGLFSYILVTVGLFAVTIFLADRLYLSGWLRMQSSGARAEGFQEGTGVLGAGSLDWTLGYKDWLIRLRDPRMLASMFSGVIVTIFFVFMFFRRGGNGSSILDLPNEFSDDGILGSVFSTGVMMSGLIYFVAWSSFSRVAGSALSIERSTFYILKCAPISASRIMRAKVFGILLPYSCLATVMLVAGMFFFDYSPLWTPYAWLVLQIMGLGIVSHAVSLDFIYPNLAWEDPRKMTNRKAGLPSLIGSALYSLAAILTALTTFVIAVDEPALAVPVTIFGLGILAGGTWFFVSHRMRRVETAWLSIGAE